VSETALHEAVRCGDKDTVAKLITSVPDLVNVNDSKGESPLFLATMTSNALDIVDVFTTKLFDSSQVACAGPNGQTALHAAVLDNEGVYSFMNNI
jgi:ankyrin repeat protein